MGGGGNLEGYEKPSLRDWVCGLPRGPRGPWLVADCAEEPRGGAGLARSLLGVCGGRENPFVADCSPSPSGLSLGRACPSSAFTASAAVAAQGQVHFGRPEWLSPLTHQPWGEAGKVLVVQKGQGLASSQSFSSTLPPCFSAHSITNAKLAV